MTDIHSCSYYCDRPNCIKAQRDELRDKVWVGLTHEEIDSWKLPDTPTVAEFAWFVEIKLKEKNT